MGKVDIIRGHFGDITNPGAANERVFLTCMKLPIYRFGLFLFIAVLLARALPFGGRHEVTSAVLIRNETLDIRGDNLALQTKAEEQDQPQQAQQASRW